MASKEQGGFQVVASIVLVSGGIGRKAIAATSLKTACIREGVFFLDDDEF
jgi:hypothetical protein